MHNAVSTQVNGERINIRRMIQNVFYVLGYAFREDAPMVMIYIMGYVTFAVGNAFVFTFMLKWIIDMIAGDALFADIAWLLLGAIVVFAFHIIINIVAENYYETHLVKVNGNIQRKLIQKAKKMDLICYDHPEYFEDFVIAAMQGETMMREAISSVAYILGNVLAMLMASGMIFSINPIIAIFPILGFIINIITRFAITKQEYLYDIEKKKINRKSDYSKRVFYQPEYAKEIKLSDIEVPLKKQFNEAIDEEIGMARKYGIRIGILSLINWIIVFTFLSYFCVPVYLGYLALVKMSIALGDVASLNNAADTIRHRLDATNYALVAFQKVGQYAQRFRRFIEYKENLEVWEGTETVPEDYTIQLRDVCYRYDGASHDTLKHINMTIHVGEKIAIVGENGAGKTTLIKLLMRLYEVTGGEITYGGKNIRNFSVQEYRSKIGAVFQDYQIYAGTLAENVVMGEATLDDRTKVLDALEKANFSAKLKKLKRDLDTELTREFSEDGTMLSGGEAQKIAISRMFMKGEHLPIAILDEPSSALDPIAEYTLNTNMMNNAKDATIIFISHRLSTTRDADRIYLFEHGEIIEQGTHDELMALQGEYAEMFEKQAHYYKLK